MDQLSRTFAALADPTRRDLVARLTAGDASVAELAAPYAMSLQAVSKHLSVLERAGLVTKRRVAQRRLEVYRRRAEERFQRLDAVLNELAADEAYPEVPVFAPPARNPQPLGRQS